MSGDHLWPQLVRIYFSSSSEMHRMQQNIPPYYNSVSVLKDLPVEENIATSYNALGLLGALSSELRPSTDMYLMAMNLQ